MEKQRSIETLTIESSSLCCNLVNTVYAWRGENLHEYLQTYDDVIAWCEKLDLLESPAMAGLRKSARLHPILAAGALEKIRKTRQQLYELISAIAAENSQQIAHTLEKIQPQLIEARSHYHLLPGKEGFSMGLTGNVGFLTPLWMALHSLAELLLTSDPARIKECPKCGWVFLDETRNGSRIWCDPAECGTQDKMRRYNARKKAALKEKSGTTTRESKKAPATTTMRPKTAVPATPVKKGRF